MVSIGLDLSINSTGVVINKNGKYEYYIITSSSSKKIKSWSDKRVKVICYDKMKVEKNDDYNVRELCKTHNVECVAENVKSILKKYKGKAVAVIEGISYGSVGSAALADLSGLNFVIRHVLCELDIDMKIISPMANKKFAVGIGNAEKEVMIDGWLKCEPKMLGVEETLKVDDIADAYFLSQQCEK